MLIEVGEQYVGYQVGLITGQFYKVLEEKDKAEFLKGKRKQGKRLSKVNSFIALQKKNNFRLP